MTLLPTGLRSRRSRIAEQFRRAVRPVGSQAALAAQVGRNGFDRARGRPVSSGAALALVGLAATLAASPRARQALRQTVSRLAGTLRAR